MRIKAIYGDYPKDYRYVTLEEAEKILSRNPLRSGEGFNSTPL